MPTKDVRVRALFTEKFQKRCWSIYDDAFDTEIFRYDGFSDEQNKMITDILLSEKRNIRYFSSPIKAAIKSQIDGAIFSSIKEGRTSHTFEWTSVYENALAACRHNILINSFRKICQMITLVEELYERFAENERSVDNDEDFIYYTWDSKKKEMNMKVLPLKTFEIEHDNAIIAMASAETLPFSITEEQKTLIKSKFSYDINAEVKAFPQLEQEERRARTIKVERFKELSLELGFDDNLKYALAITFLVPISKHPTEDYYLVDTNYIYSRISEI